MTTTVDDTRAIGRVLLRGVSWATYEALVAEVENGGTRFTYDRGELEITTPSHRHGSSCNRGVLPALGIESTTES